jgi:diadenosine tetraphosphate (Ap4A) HIT family hydrolase
VTSLDHLWAGWRREYIEGVSGAGDPAIGEGSTGGSPSSASAAGDVNGCVFCAILASGLPDEETHILWRHPKGGAVAILNAYPYTSGHLMVMPVRHVPDFEDLDEDEACQLWSGLRDSVAAVREAYTPDGLNIGANLGRPAGAGIPGHLHLHVVPRWTGDTNFMTTVAGARVLPESLEVSGDKIRRAWPAT